MKIEMKKILLEKVDIMDKEITNPETGNKIKISSALTYDKNHPAYINAKKLVDKVEKMKSAPKLGPNKEIVEQFKKYGLTVFPKANVPLSKVKVNLKGNLDTHAVLKWKDPDTGLPMASYTPGFKDNNAKIKWARIKKIKEKNIVDIKEKSDKLLDKKDSQLQEAGAIVSIISQTGLRPGSKIGFEKTENRGVSTLGPKNIRIMGDKIILNFIGKSTKENNAELKDATLARFLEKRIHERKNEQFLFDLSDVQLDKVYATKIEPSNKNIKIKDMRTYIATKIAKTFLKNDKSEPPPLPENSKKIKSSVKAKLKRVYELVSQKLNNSPAMAKSSYVHPEVIKLWLKELGVKPSIVENVYNDLSMTNILKEIREDEEIKKLESEMDPNDLENCDEYNLPDWWDNDKIELVSISKSE